ncbi:MAG TPA: DUF192 domain-containing protein [Candidatus Limnocylindrales bacterium]|nr:DUF192 domain-containing protein [Candidatus Limnocylindrales bacterium]
MDKRIAPASPLRRLASPPAGLLRQRPRRIAGSGCRADFRERIAGAFVLAAALLISTAAGCSRAEGPQVVVHGAQGDAVVRVELALTRDDQARGLMWRKELAADAGMLFVFDKDEERSFWMRNTPLPLDILYIRSDGVIDSIAANTRPYSEESIPSKGPARYVLEVNAGWSKRHGVKPGDKVTLPPQARPDAHEAGRAPAP